MNSLTRLLPGNALILQSYLISVSDYLPAPLTADDVKIPVNNNLLITTNCYIYK